MTRDSKKRKMLERIRSRIKISNKKWTWRNSALEDRRWLIWNTLTSACKECSKKGRTGKLSQECASKFKIWLTTMKKTGSTKYISREEMQLIMKASRKSMYRREASLPLKLLCWAYRLVEADVLVSNPTFRARVILNRAAENCHGQVQLSNHLHLKDTVKVCTTCCKS